MPVYTYLAMDLRTGTIIAELPLTNVMFSRILNGAGDFRAELPVTSPAQLGIDLTTATEPARTVLLVDRDGVLQWAGIIWTDDFRSSQAGWPIAGLELWSYFRHRLISGTRTYTSTDQLAIARDLVNYAQAKPGGNAGVAVGSETAGVNRNRTYYGDEYKSVAEAIEQLAAVEQGFDFSIDPTYAAGVPSFPLHLYYPRRGRPAVSTGHVFQYPGNVLEFRWPRDGTETATTCYTVGTGTDNKRPYASASTQSLIDAGYPLLENATTILDDVSQANLTSHAIGNARARGGVIVNAELKVRADQDPVLGSYVTGDDARVILRHPARFPGPANSLDGLDHTLDTFLRILGYTVIPEREEVALVMGAITV